MRPSGPIARKTSVMATLGGRAAGAVLLAREPSRGSGRGEARLDEQRSSVPEAGSPAVEIEIDEQRVVAEGHGRKGWLREGRRQLEQRREREQRPIPRSRADRLREAKQRLEEAHAVELAANAAFEAHHRNRLRSDGRRFAPPRPLTLPVLPEGRVNVVDPDSRVMRTQGQPTVQGYNAQAAVTAGQIIVAAEITIESPDFGHLEPVFDAARRDLELAGVNEQPGVVVADAGYWHKEQMENIVSDGTQVLIPPDSDLERGTAGGVDRPLYDFMRRVLATEHGHAIYRQRQETIEPVFGHAKHNRGFRRFPTTRQIPSPFGVATDGSNAQPPKAPQPLDRHRLSGPSDPRRASHRALRESPQAAEIFSRRPPSQAGTRSAYSCTAAPPA